MTTRLAIPFKQKCDYTPRSTRQIIFVVLVVNYSADPEIQLPTMLLPEMTPQVNQSISRSMLNCTQIE